MKIVVRKRSGKGSQVHQAKTPSKWYGADTPCYIKCREYPNCLCHNYFFPEDKYCDPTNPCEFYPACACEAQ